MSASPHLSMPEWPGLTQADEGIGIKGAMEGVFVLVSGPIISWGKNSECCYSYINKQEDQYLQQMLVLTSSGMSYGYVT